VARAAGDPQAAGVITPFIRRRAPERPPPPEKLPPVKPPKSDKPAGQQGRRWLGGVFGWLNPFGRKSKVVDLREHEMEEMVWDGTRYVNKGHENDPPTRRSAPDSVRDPPPPLPGAGVGSPPSPPETGADAPLRSPGTGTGPPPPPPGT
jgi:hypothetical protein